VLVSNACNHRLEASVENLSLIVFVIHETSVDEIWDRAKERAPSGAQSSSRILGARLASASLQQVSSSRRDRGRHHAQPLQSSTWKPRNFQRYKKIQRPDAVRHPVFLGDLVWESAT
jgi:hypothetical protein